MRASLACCRLFSGLAKAQGTGRLTGSVTDPAARARTERTVLYGIAPDGRVLISTEFADWSTEHLHLILNWKPQSK
ncbi:MAG TPA: hypothetical protein VEV17_17820 [Bryobacteraceae bacterium]|nr:hypothetical protein [Bryobacteraceae bacterium]